MGNIIMLLKLAWRNSFRNKRRTFLSALAIGIGLAVLIFSDAFIIGMIDNMVKTATATFMGDGQIHRNGFRKTLDIDLTINDSGRVIDELKSDKRVKASTQRTIAFAMISSPANAASMLLYGVEPLSESKISYLKRAVIRGDYFSINEPDKILIGAKMAKTLGVDIGDKVVVTGAQAGSGDLSQAMFRIGGIFNFNIREMDGNMAFIDIKKAQELLALTNKVHEIALDCNEAGLEESMPQGFLKRFSAFDNEALGWKELMPELNAVISWSNIAIAIVAIIQFGVVAFGIMNTLFMSLYERMYEFGVLRAVGTRPKRLSMMILFEAAVLAFFSIIIGCIIGFLLTKYFSVYGFDLYAGIDYSGITFNEPIYPVLKVVQFIKYPILLFVFTILVGLYPAIYAAFINPSKAMKRSL